MYNSTPHLEGLGLVQQKSAKQTKNSSCILQQTTTLFLFEKCVTTRKLSSFLYRYLCGNHWQRT